MTIQRQYSLPNCTLIVEGLGDMISFNSTDLRPLLSTVINAEFRLMGRDKPLSGGREFLDSLVVAISHYTQEILSGLNTTRTNIASSGSVQVQRVDDNTHRLSIRPEPLPGALTPPTTEVNLSTVELFDLVEAVDQLLADTQTLPDLSLSLAPVSRKEVIRAKPATKQVIPAAIGVSSLAAATLALSLLPVPKVQQPKELYPVRADQTATGSNAAKNGLTPATGSPSPSPTGSPSPAATASPAASPSPNLKTLETALTSAPEIKDTAQLDSLSGQLRQKLDESWKTRSGVTQDLVYRVGVAADGALLGYKPVNPAAAENAKAVPLLDLVARQGDRSPSEPLAQLKVVFTPSGGIEVAPWQEVMTSPITGITEITETAQLEAILPKLKDQINQGWATRTPTINEELIYKVRVRQNGGIVDYSPENDAAARNVQETPLSKLGKPVVDSNSTPTQEPVALFKVVFRPPDGATEISPWRGWQN
jgi:Domain of unknown function (DUF4335)